MFNADRIKTNIKPKKVEDLGNGIWYYNYDIIELLSENPDEVTYDFILVRILGKPDYNKCVKAVIRAYIDSDLEFDLINSYSSYQMDINTTYGNYEEYLQLVKEIKEKVSKDFNIIKLTNNEYKIKLSDIVKLLLMSINSFSLSDELSLKVKSIYPDWESFIGLEVQAGTKLKYQDKLFKVMLTHSVLSLYFPSINTSSLYTEIVEDSKGTLNDPIPYSGNMEIFKGKYYMEDGIIYECIRNSGQPLYNKLSDLIGNYVQIVN